MGDHYVSDCSLCRYRRCCCWCGSPHLSFSSSEQLWLRSHTLSSVALLGICNRRVVLTYRLCENSNVGQVPEKVHTYT